MIFKGQRVPFSNFMQKNFTTSALLSICMIPTASTQSNHMSSVSSVFVHAFDSWKTREITVKKTNDDKGEPER